MSNAAVEKTLWRRRMKSRFELMRPHESAHLRERLHENVALVVGARPGLWASYHPLPGEADPGLGAPPGVEWVYPRMQDEALVFCRAGNLCAGRFGVTEPHPSSEAVTPEELAGVLVPGIAFDREGRRLGRGRGYYDRTLAEYRGLTVGVAYSVQILDEVPSDPWDVAMRAIVTEESVFWGGSKKWKS